MWPGRFKEGSSGCESVTRFAALVAANADVKSHCVELMALSAQSTSGSGEIFGASTWIGWLDGLGRDSGGARTVINDGAVGSAGCVAEGANDTAQGTREASAEFRGQEGSESP